MALPATFDRKWGPSITARRRPRPRNPRGIPSGLRPCLAAPPTDLSRPNVTRRSTKLGQWAHRRRRAARTPRGSRSRPSRRPGGCWGSPSPSAPPVAYVAALAAVIVSWGLPLARGQLFFWVLLGLAAFSVAAWRSGAHAARLAPWLGLLVAYDGLRGAVSVPRATPTSPRRSPSTAARGGAVPTVWLQQRLWSAGHLHWYDYGVWGVYLTHFFVVWLVAAMLWRAARARFAPLRDRDGRPHAVGVPRLLALPGAAAVARGEAGRIGPVDRIVPLVWDHIGLASIESVYDNGGLVNTVAAMPSLHAAYPMMLLLFFWDAGRARPGRPRRCTRSRWATRSSTAASTSSPTSSPGWAMAALASAAVAVAFRAAGRLRAGAARTTRSSSSAAAR